MLDGHLTCGRASCDEAAARARRQPPTVVADGICWFTTWPDDSCSVCRGRLPEDEVPLMLWKDVGDQTWQAQFCETCTPMVLELFNTSATRH